MLEYRVVWYQSGLLEVYVNKRVVLSSCGFVGDVEDNIILVSP